MPRTQPRVRAYALAGLAITGLAFTSLCGFAPHAQAEETPVSTSPVTNSISLPTLPEISVPSLPVLPAQGVLDAVPQPAIAQPVAEAQAAITSSVLSSSLGLPDFWELLKKNLTEFADSLGFGNLLPAFLRWTPPATETTTQSGTASQNQTTTSNTEEGQSQSGTSTTGTDSGNQTGATENRAIARSADSAAMSATLSGAGQASGTCSSTYRVTANRLVWGVKESFRSYISGSIANGRWDLNGTNYENGNFVWTGTTGSANSQDRSGIAQLNGSVRFTGHNGVLDMTISAPEIVYRAGTGQLMATVVSNDMNGNAVNYGRIAIANLSFAQLNLSNGVLTGATDSVTLTDAGARAFGDFYKAGDKLDALTFASAMSDTCGSSASTSASSATRSSSSTSTSRSTTSRSTTGSTSTRTAGTTGTSTSAAPSSEAAAPTESQFQIKETPSTESNSDANEDSNQAAANAAEDNILKKPWLWVAIVIILVLVAASAVVRARKAQSGAAATTTGEPGDNEA
ncbi:MAG: HtaA domain-containing protein [Corynebacterium sp.]|nr:HtaA domain-containing protein [Corynebacterium sp.]